MTSLRAVLLVAVALQANAELRDPTQPRYLSSAAEGYVTAIQSRYQLSSLLIGDHRRSAVINGKRVVEGEWIDSARVLSIRKSGVTIRVQDTKINLALSTYEIKK